MQQAPQPTRQAKSVMRVLYTGLTNCATRGAVAAAMHRSSLSSRAALFAGVLLVTACAATPTGGAIDEPDPPPLPAAAAAIVRARIAAFDGSDGPGDLFGKPGTATAADGRLVTYDRYLLVGSTLTEDRGRAFDRFVEEIEAAGARYFVFHRRADGRPAKILLTLDEQRIVATVQQW